MSSTARSASSSARDALIRRSGACLTARRSPSRAGRRPRRPRRTSRSARPRRRPGDPVRFELLIPGETDAHTTEVSLQIPKGVLPFSFEDQPGWKRTVEHGGRRQRRRRALARAARERRLRALRVPRGDARAGGRADVEGRPALRRRRGGRLDRAARRREPGGRDDGQRVGAAPERRRRGRRVRGAGRRRAGGTGDTAASEASPRRDARARSRSSSARAGLVLGAAALAVALRRSPREPA